MADLHFDDLGGNGPPMLLVHGFLSSRAQWSANIDDLRACCRPILVELLGHGRSPSPVHGSAYTVDAYMGQFEAIRSHLGIDRWLLCGQSFGAGLTLHYADRLPEQTIGQIFTNSISALLPASDPSERERVASEIEAGGTTAIERLPFFPSRGARFAPGTLDELLEDAAKISPHAIGQAIRHTSSGLYAMEALTRSKIPSLLINGIWERKFQALREMTRLQAPGLKIVDLEGGHSINIENPHGFSKAVSDFISSVPVQVRFRSNRT